MQREWTDKQGEVERKKKCITYIYIRTIYIWINERRKLRGRFVVAKSTRAEYYDSVTSVRAVPL